MDRFDFWMGPVFAVRSPEHFVASTPAEIDRHAMRDEVVMLCLNVVAHGEIMTSRSDVVDTGKNREAR